MRNRTGLTPTQIENCEKAFNFFTSPDIIENTITGLEDNILKDFSVTLDTSRASKDGSKTVYSDDRNCIILGADAYQGNEGDANSRMSYMACLAHEISHAQRKYIGFDRTPNGKEGEIDEAEASLHASLFPALTQIDRKDLVEDAQQRLKRWHNLED